MMLIMLSRCLARLLVSYDFDDQRQTAVISIKTRDTEDEGSYGREGEHMVGGALLVAPILKKSATECKSIIT